MNGISEFDKIFGIVQNITLHLFISKLFECMSLNSPDKNRQNAPAVIKYCDVVRTRLPRLISAWLYISILEYHAGPSEAHIIKHPTLRDDP